MTSVLKVDNIQNSSGTDAISIDNDEISLITSDVERMLIKSDGKFGKTALTTPLKIEQFNLSNSGSQTTTTSSSYSNTYSCTYTPQSDNSKIIMIAQMNFWADVDNDSQGNVSAQLRLQTTQDSTTTTRFEGAANKLNQGGQSRYQCIPVQVEFNISSTSNITFQWSHKRTAGSRSVVSGGAVGNRLTIIEVQR